MMKTVKMMMHIPKKYDKKRGDDIESSWEIIINAFENECTQALKAAEENTDSLAIISKLMNMKDNLTKQLYISMIYRKILIWKDLNIQSEDFVDSTVVKIINYMDEMADNLGYIPTKPLLEEVKLDTPGEYTATGDGVKRYSESIENMHALALAFMEMENLIKKNFKLSEEKREKFTENNPVLETLRNQLEDVYKQKEKILEDMRRNESLMIGGERKELLEMNMEIEKLKLENKSKDKEIDSLERSLKNYQSALTKSKHDLKTVTEARKNLETWLKPKLNEAKKYQKELSTELNKIRQDAELLPSMFRAEAQFRNKCKQEKEEAEIRMKEAVDEYN